MLTLSPPPRVVTFDCYGTLVQWHRAMRAAARAVLRAHHPDGDPGGDEEERARGLADGIRAAATARQGRAPHLGYKDVLRSGLAEAMGGLGLTAGEAAGETLLSFLRAIEPHPEVPGVLGRLRGRFRLGIISNTDDDLIAGTVGGLGAPVDFVVTAEQARAYKPDHRLFRHAHAVMGVDAAETVHVGMGQFTDMKVCHELGIRSVWIDRDGEPAVAEWPADAVLRDLSGLEALLGA